MPTPLYSIFSQSPSHTIKILMFLQPTMKVKNTGRNWIYLNKRKSKKETSSNWTFLKTFSHLEMSNANGTTTRAKAKNAYTNKACRKCLIFFTLRDYFRKPIFAICRYSIDLKICHRVSESLSHQKWYFRFPNFKY